MSSIENVIWPPCRAVSDQGTTHRLYVVVEHVDLEGSLDPTVWWTACGIQMRSTRRRNAPRYKTDEMPRADVLPPSRSVTCLACLAGES